MTNHCNISKNSIPVPVRHKLWLVKYEICVNFFCFISGFQIRIRIFGVPDSGTKFRYKYKKNVSQINTFLYFLKWGPLRNFCWQFLHSYHNCKNVWKKFQHFVFCFATAKNQALDSDPDRDLHSFSKPSIRIRMKKTRIGNPAFN